MPGDRGRGKEADDRHRDGRRSEDGDRPQRLAPVDDSMIRGELRQDMETVDERGGELVEGGVRLRRARAAPRLDPLRRQGPDIGNRTALASGQRALFGYRKVVVETLGQLLDV